MPTYQAPLMDMRFLLKEVWDLEQHLQKYFPTISLEDVDAVLDEAAKIHENTLFPLNQIGDKEGCRLLEDHTVHTPTGFKQAYQLLQTGGWLALTGDPEYGGGGFPHMVGVLNEEMLASCNVSFQLYSNLTAGVARAIKAHANDALKQTYLPKLITGQWSGAMCLTESHCGTDLGLIRTKATAVDDTAYHLSGTKIFITAGEHDLVENIIHLVLARIEGAPAGNAGISLFLVPKFMVNKDGKLGDRNQMVCSALEHKMGIKGSATCVINYDNALGYLVGEENKGLNAMFTVMNIERLAIGLQGLGLAEVSYQNARNYARERLQSRSPSGAKYPDKAADPLIVHPDVRRMLLWMRAHNEAARALGVWVSQLVDISEQASAAEAQEADALVQFLTPLTKAFVSDCGFDACNHGIQVLGGHGYISEWGLEQYARDARIAQIYEGSNGIQALDLVKRKLIANKGASLQVFIQRVKQTIAPHQTDRELTRMFEGLTDAIHHLQMTSEWIITQANDDPNDPAAVAVEYLHLLGLTVFAFMWFKIVVAALAHQQHGKNNFYAVKIKTANFYFQKILPKITSLMYTIRAGGQAIMSFEDEEI